jgi:hypothetical protein
MLSITPSQARVPILCCLQKKFDLHGIEWKLHSASIVALYESDSR